MAKVMLLDCDGVVADFMQHTIDVLRIPMSREDCKDFYIESNPGFEEYGEQMHALWATPEFWQTLPVIDGAVQGVNKMRQKFDIVWCTSPYEDCPMWYWSRLQWLKKYFPFTTRKNLIATHRKELVSGTHLVDDKPKNVERWQKTNPHGIAYLMDQPWNRDFEWKRVDWPLLMEMF